jgi:ADP-ribose pyrophosphatase
MTESHPGSSPLRDEPVALDVISSKRLYDGRVWDVFQDEIVYGDGTITRDYVRHTGAVAVLAMDENGRVLVIKQYRHPVRLREWEIPAGLLDLAGEDPLVCAQRELAEEVDLIADTWHVLADYASSPGGSDEIIRVYLARDLHSTAAPHPREAEEGDMELRWVSLGDGLEAINTGAVGNSIFTISMFSADYARNHNWSTLRPADAPWPQLAWRDER